VLLDFKLAFPVKEVAPSTDEAEPTLTSIMPIDKARATPKTLGTIFAIGYGAHRCFNPFRFGIRRMITNNMQGMENKIIYRVSTRLLLIIL
jgi:hypothetical protein